MLERASGMRNDWRCGRGREEGERESIIRYQVKRRGTGSADEYIYTDKLQQQHGEVVRCAHRTSRHRRMTFH